VPYEKGGACREVWGPYMSRGYPPVKSISLPVDRACMRRLACAQVSVPLFDEPQKPVPIGLNVDGTRGGDSGTVCRRNGCERERQGSEQGKGKSVE